MPDWLLSGSPLRWLDVLMVGGSITVMFVLVLVVGRR